jgi:hypothetical protein
MLQMVAGAQRIALAACNNLAFVQGGIDYGTCTGVGTCTNYRLNDTCTNMTLKNCQFVTTVQDHVQQTNCSQQPGGNWTCTGTVISAAGNRDEYTGSSCS